MSNVIKSYSVRYDDEAKKTIDTHLRIDKELESRRSTIFQAVGTSEGFVEGLKAVAVEELPTEEETSEKASKVLEDANNKAQQIIDGAKEEAEQLKSDMFSAAQKKGYEEGMLQAKREAQKLKTDYEEKTRKLQKEYGELVLSLEPQIARIVAALVEKMTGILVEDKKDVIIYLVSKAIKNLDKSNEYTIKVSKEDYEYISARKDSLLSAIGREVSLYITEDAGLTKNQCLIETDSHVINCSLDVQLNNLLSDLKLIGTI